MPVFGELPRESNTARQDENTPATPATPISLSEDLHPRPQTNLARGIVWADILADIAADEAARQQLREAA